MHHAFMLVVFSDMESGAGYVCVNSLRIQRRGRHEFS